jgi:hypothetical protein
MGVFVRPDSPVWWLWLETTRQKERTEIRIGTTAAQKYDSRKLAEDRYHQRMNEIAARLYKLPSATPTIRFTKYAETYRTDTIAHHKGAERERELLQVLVAFFGTDLLTAIDPDRVRSYMTARRKTVARRHRQSRSRSAEGDAARRRAEVPDRLSDRRLGSAEDDQAETAAPAARRAQAAAGGGGSGGARAADSRATTA